LVSSLILTMGVEFNEVNDTTLVVLILFEFMSVSWCVIRFFWKWRLQVFKVAVGFNSELRHLMIENEARFSQKSVQSEKTETETLTSRATSIGRVSLGSEIRPRLESWNKLQGLNDTGLLKSWMRRVDNVRIGDLIGKGNFGEVFGGTWRNWRIAAKRVILTEKEEKNTQNALDFYKEGFILQELNKVGHQNVLRFVGMYTMDGVDYIVTEYCSRQTLENLLITENLSLQDRLYLIHDIGEGLDYISNEPSIRNILHLDLTIRNLLVTDSIEEDKRFCVKLSDFGLSKFGKIVRDSQKIQFQPKYTAPEVWKGGEITAKADIWSLGVVMWEIFSNGKNPYLTQKEIEDGERLPQPEECPDEIYSLMRTCWDVLPANRPNSQQVTRVITDYLHNLPPNPNSLRLSIQRTQSFNKPIPGNNSSTSSASSGFNIGSGIYTSSAEDAEKLKVMFISPKADVAPVSNSVGTVETASSSSIFVPPSQDDYQTYNPPSSHASIDSDKL